MICEMRDVQRDVRIALFSIWCDERFVQGQESVGDRCSYGIEPLRD